MSWNILWQKQRKLSNTQIIEITKQNQETNWKCSHLSKYKKAIASKKIIIAMTETISNVEVHECILKNWLLVICLWRFAGTQTVLNWGCQTFCKRPHSKYYNEIVHTNYLVTVNYSFYNKSKISLSYLPWHYFGIIHYKIRMFCFLSHFKWAPNP